MVILPLDILGEGTWLPVVPANSPVIGAASESQCGAGRRTTEMVIKGDCLSANDWMRFFPLLELLETLLSFWIAWAIGFLSASALNRLIG